MPKATQTMQAGILAAILAAYPVLTPQQDVIQAAIQAAIPNQTVSTEGTHPDLLLQAPTFSTVRQFSEKHPAFSQGSLRNLIHLSIERYSSKGKIPANGLHVALVRIGRKVLIDDKKFFEWVEKQNQKVGA